MTTEDLITRAGRSIMNTYNRFPVCLVRGTGTRVWDTDGREYLVGETTDEVGLGMIAADQADFSKWIGIQIGR